MSFSPEERAWHESSDSGLHAVVSKLLIATQQKLSLQTVKQYSLRNIET